MKKLVLVAIEADLFITDWMIKEQINETGLVVKIIKTIDPESNLLSQIGNITKTTNKESKE